MKNTSSLLALAFLALVSFSCSKERFVNDPGNLVPKTVDQDPGLPSILVNGVLLHSEAFGHPDSTMIVCIHGGPGGDYRYLLNCKDLANYGYRVVFYDQRGSGLSQRLPKASYTSLGLAALDAVFNELGGVIAHYRTNPNQKVILLGHSWGGILATGYAGKNPGAIQGLIVGEPGGLKWAEISEYIKKSNAFNLWGESLNDATYTDQFVTGREDQHEILDYKLALLAGTNEITGENNTEPGSAWRSGAVIRDAFLEIGENYRPDFSEGIGQFKTPVLFFFSEKNKAYPDSWAHKISGAYPLADLHKVAGVGHSGIFQDKKTWQEKTLPKLLTYLNSL